jgi:hypothetical protein
MKWTATLPVLAVLLLLSTVALAQSSQNYRVEWSTLSGGGQTSSSAHFVINGSIVGGASGPPNVSSDHFVVGGGYWPGIVPVVSYEVYLPLLFRNW